MNVCLKVLYNIKLEVVKIQADIFREPDLAHTMHSTNIMACSMEYVPRILKMTNLPYGTLTDAITIHPSGLSTYSLFSLPFAFVPKLYVADIEGMASDEPSRSLEESLQIHLDRLLTFREFPKTICPSEVARSLTDTELRQAGVSSWRDTMPLIRSMVWTMRDRGEVEVLQRGQPLAQDTALEDVRGPIRVRKIMGV